MALYQVTIAYDGTGFRGFQRQKGSRTVQNEIEKTLLKLGWQERSILSAGRTDTGVHAERQIIAFNLDWQHSTEDLKRAINDRLPLDVAVMNVQNAPQGFHPRFDATLRKYRYQLYFNDTRDPIMERYHWQVWPKPDLELVRKCSRFFIGTHNFRAYGRPPDKNSSEVRTIEDVSWEYAQDSDRASFRISAKAFLYHMVRRIVYVLVRVGQYRIDASDVKESIDGKMELPAGIAPANGLILEQIIY
jgi:tRNA pseudouridine38-40 synthase